MTGQPVLLPTEHLGDGTHNPLAVGRKSIVALGCTAEVCVRGLRSVYRLSEQAEEMPCKLHVNSGADGSVITYSAKSMVTTSAPGSQNLMRNHVSIGNSPTIAFKSWLLFWRNAFAGKDAFARCMSVFAKELPVLGT